MNRDDLRAFARRDWTAIERGKREYWAERFRRDGAGPARRASSALSDHARHLGLSPLNPADRAADLAHHTALRDRLDRAARALTGR